MKAFLLSSCLMIFNLISFCFNSLIKFVKFFRSLIIKLNLKLIYSLVFSFISTLDIFNLWTWSWLSVLELIGSIEKELDMKINYEMVWRRDWDLAEVYCDTSKANKILWFQSRFTLKESITNTWKFYNEELYEK